MNLRTGGVDASGNPLAFNSGAGSSDVNDYLPEAGGGAVVVGVGDDEIGLSITQNDSTNDPHALDITVAAGISGGNAINIANAGIGSFLFGEKGAVTVELNYKGRLILGASTNYNEAVIECKEIFGGGKAWDADGLGLGYWDSAGLAGFRWKNTNLGGTGDVNCHAIEVLHKSNHATPGSARESVYFYRQDLNAANLLIRGGDPALHVIPGVNTVNAGIYSISSHTNQTLLHLEAQAGHTGVKCLFIEDSSGNVDSGNIHIDTIVAGNGHCINIDHDPVANGPTADILHIDSEWTPTGAGTYTGHMINIAMDHDDSSGGTYSASALKVDAKETTAPVIDLDADSTVSGNIIDISNSGSGADINATNWDVAKDGNATFNSVVVGSEVDNGDSGTGDDIDFGTSNHQLSTLTDDVTYTFTDPSGPGMFTLRLVQGASPPHLATWPGIVKWAGGSGPTLSTGLGEIDLITFYFDGTNYYEVSVSLDLQ